MAHDDLIGRCRIGDEDAARELFDAYVARLIPLARRRISRAWPAASIPRISFNRFFERFSRD